MSLNDSYEKNWIAKKSPSTAAVINQIKEKRNQQNFRFYENLMRHDTHHRVGGRIRQQRWGR